MSERVVICGSRDWKSFDVIERRVKELPPETLVIAGGARGADSMAAGAARHHGYFVAEIECGKEHWEAYKRRAGYLRNCAMLDLNPLLVIAFTTGSRGTALTIGEAAKRGISVEVIGSHGDILKRLNWPVLRDEGAADA